MQKPIKKQGPPKGVSNNPNGRPKKEPTQAVYKRVPKTIYNNCLSAVNTIVEDYKNNPQNYGKQ